MMTELEFEVLYPFKTMEQIESMSDEEYSEFLAWGDDIAGS